MQNDTLNIDRIKTLLAGQTDWRAAVEKTVGYLIAEGQCFSSGEVARWLRICEPSLVFSVPRLGEHIRDMFYSGSMPQYPDDGWGNPVSPSQMPRTTQGFTRTPAGVEVMVYCPDSSEGFAHGFEVDIPRPGEAPTQYPVRSNITHGVSGGGAARAFANNVLSSGTPGTSQTSKAAVQITGAHAKPIVSLKASVQQDRRLQVPRAAFEALVHFCGVTLRGGDPVFVLVGSNRATITLLDPNNGAKKYDLWSDSGRVSFPSTTTPFNPGDTFLVDVAPTGLTVDLTITV